MITITSLKQIDDLEDGTQFIIDPGFVITPGNFDKYLEFYNQAGQALKTRKPKNKKSSTKKSKNART